MFHKCLVESSTTCGFGFKDASFKTICSTGAWWIFSQPVVFCSELANTKKYVPHVPGGCFHDLWSLQFGLSIFFSSQFGPWFGKFDLNLVIYVSGTVTTLNGVSRVNSSILYFFLKFFYYLFIFWIFIKN